MTTVSIPLVTLTVGTHNFPPTGGQGIADGESVIALTIDRTVANGMNSQPGTTQIAMQTFQSDDGGATWMNRAAATFTGGIFSKGGNQLNTDGITTQLSAGTGRQVRAVVTVSGASVAVAGSLTTS